VVTAEMAPHVPRSSPENPPPYDPSFGACDRALHAHARALQQARVRRRAPGRGTHFGVGLGEGLEEDGDLGRGGVRRHHHDRHDRQQLGDVRAREEAGRRRDRNERRGVKERQELAEEVHAGLEELVHLSPRAPVTSRLHYTHYTDRRGEGRASCLVGSALGEGEEEGEHGKHAEERRRDRDDSGARERLLGQRVERHQRQQRRDASNKAHDLCRQLRRSRRHKFGGRRKLGGLPCAPRVSSVRCNSFPRDVSASECCVWEPGTPCRHIWDIITSDVASAERESTPLGLRERGIAARSGAAAASGDTATFLPDKFLRTSQV
jgi:hypothetical protein